MIIFAYWYLSPLKLCPCFSFWIQAGFWLVGKSDSRRGHKSNAASLWFSLRMLYPWIPATILWGSPRGPMRKQPQVRVQPAASTSAASPARRQTLEDSEPNPTFCSYWRVGFCVLPSVDFRHQRQLHLHKPFQIPTWDLEYNQMAFVLHLWVFILPPVLDHRLQQQCHSLQLLKAFFLLFYHWLLGIGGKFIT